MTMTNKSY